MPEVVVADGVPGQPRVLGGEGVGVEDGVEEAEIHGLFGVADARRVGNDGEPEGEEGEEYQLGDERRAPFPVEVVQDGVAVSVGHPGG